MPTLTIDGQEIEVEANTTVLQAAEELGIQIPRFCYHDRLSIAGNCRMCLVEMEGPPKPIASCAMPVGEGMVIHTNSEVAIKARKGAMEFLLINHPLDCPICDQGGECDLQDQAVAFGRGDSRYSEHKRAVKDKYLGPLIATSMTRCITCTRCIRFATEIAGVEELGATFRGEETEIGTYVEEALTSELSGNLVDVCPVGALTNQAYAFNARPWELRKTESIDVHDAVGCNIRIDCRGNEVLRVLPRLHEDVNEEWLGDRSRYAVDGLGLQRLDRPYVRVDGKLKPASWDAAFAAIKARMDGADGGRMAAIAGDMADVEAMLALKEMFTALGSPNLDCRQDGAKIGGKHRGGYIFNSSIAGIEDADAILLVGTNPRWEATLVNARIRKRWLRGGLAVGVIGGVMGSNDDLTYKYDYLGAGPATLTEIADGSHAFAKVLADAERPMIILGSGAVARDDGAAVLDLARRVAEQNGMISGDWNGFNILHRAASRVGGLDLGFLPGDDGRDVAGIVAGAGKGEIDLVWLLGADEIDMQALGQAFVVYQGHHGDAGAHRADVILPGAAYTEKDATWVNTEGRVQLGRRAAYPPGEAREDWSILRAFSAVLDQPLPYDSLAQLRQHMVEAVPSLGEVDEVGPGEMGAMGVAGDVSAAPFESPVADYYLANAICRASAVMADSSRLYLNGEEATGTDG
ncbi:MAG: NADH-quinone oxidoreductase subunit G [Rhodospirillaceae bacterium]|jgi:NADH-quinone oxidoreductase subunit G|nr:NADH-quinone oxidoreductase subunit G [Rhodospirillaceae bacterium]MBT5896095.1 NADH-quinone oxidoreductase subunit G [Rhodospirillaceae bacterium]